MAIKKVLLTPQNVDQMANEVGIMKECQHPNIVQYMDSFMIKVYIYIYIIETNIKVIT